MSPHTCAGSLSLKELENMLLDDQSNPCTKEQCRELFESFDDDDNGEISLDEFKTGIKMFLGIQNEKMQACQCTDAQGRPRVWELSVRRWRCCVR